MTIRTFKEVRDILIKKGFTKSLKNKITGEEYDIWTKEKFISKCELKDNIKEEK